MQSQLQVGRGEAGGGGALHGGIQSLWMTEPLSGAPGTLQEGKTELPAGLCFSPEETRGLPSQPTGRWQADRMSGDSTVLSRTPQRTLVEPVSLAAQWGGPHLPLRFVGVKHDRGIIRWCLINA